MIVKELNLGLQTETVDPTVFQNLWGAVSMFNTGTVRLRQIVSDLFTYPDLVPGFYEEWDMSDLEDEDTGWYDPYRTVQIQNALTIAAVEIPPRPEPVVEPEPEQ